MPDPEKLEHLVELNKDLLRDWKRNRLVLKRIGGLKLEHGQVMDARLQLEADYLAGLDDAYDVPGRSGAGAANYDEWKRRKAELDAAADANRATIQGQIAEYEKKVAALQSQKVRLAAQLERLARTDARSDVERAGGEPPHPPYARMSEVQAELGRVREDLALEKRLLEARQRDAARLDQARERAAADLEKRKWWKR